MTEPITEPITDQEWVDRARRLSDKRYPFQFLPSLIASTAGTEVVAPIDDSAPETGRWIKGWVWVPSKETMAKNKAAARQKGAP